MQSNISTNSLSAIAQENPVSDKTIVELADEVNGLKNIVTILVSHVATLEGKLNNYTSQPAFLPIKQVVAQKLIPKSERTIRQWVKDKARLGYHYQYCGKTLMLEVSRFTRLLNGFED